MSTISHVKNLGQVAAVILSDTAPKITYILWYDTNENELKVYDSNTGSWISLSRVLVSVENIGLGQGLIYKGKSTSGALQIRTLKGEGGIEVETTDNEVIIRIESYLRTLQTQLVLDKEKDSIAVLQIESNIDWIIESDKVDWAALSKTSGNKSETIIVTALSENAVSDVREFVLTVKDKNGILPSIKVIVMQQGTEVQNSIYINPSSYTFTNMGGTTTFGILVVGGTGDYTVTSNSNEQYFWVTSKTPTALTISAGINANSSSRSTTIVLTHSDGTTTQTLNIAQQGTQIYEGIYGWTTFNDVVDKICQTT